MTSLRRSEAWVLASCAVLANLVSFLDRQTLTALAPTVRGDLDISQSAYGWLASGFYGAYLFAAPIAGRLLDRHGARRGLLVSVPIWTAIAALHALIPGFWMLLGLRMALAVAEAPALPGCAQAVTRALPPLDRPRGLSLLFVGSSLGAAISGPLALAISNAWSWQYAFLGTAVLGALWVPLWLAVAWRPRARAALDTRPPATTPGPRPGALELLRDPTIRRAVIVYLLVSPAVAFSGVWTAEMLVTDHGVLKSGVGHYMWLPPLAIDLGAVLFGDLFARLAKRRGEYADRILFSIAAAAMASGACAAAIVAWSPWSAISCVALMMFGAGGIYTLMLAETAQRAGSAVALIGGFLVSAQSLMFIIVNPIIGQVVQRTHTFAGVLAGIAIGAVCAAAVWIHGARRTVRS
jgi:ACS family hexuronate transporter-like MFS transporter